MLCCISYCGHIHVCLKLNIVFCFQSLFLFQLVNTQHKMKKTSNLGKCSHFMDISRSQNENDAFGMIVSLSTAPR